MAGLIGLLAGGVLGKLSADASAKAEQGRQHEQMWDQFMMSNIEQNPEFAGTPQGQKEIKRLWGPHAEGATAMLGLKAHAQQQFAQDMAGGGARPMGQPQGGGMGGVQVAGANQAGAPSGMGQVDALRAELTRMQGLRGKYMNNPQYSAILNQHITDLEKEIGSVQHDAEYQQNQARLDQQFQATEADRASARADRQQARAESQADRASARADREQARQDAESERKTYHDQMLSLQKERDADKREQQTATLAKSLDAGRDKILADFAKLPDASKPNAKARVDAHNEAASKFYRKHAGEGAPTLLKWTDGKPGGILGVGGVAPTIEAVPPKYVTDPKSGKSGWMDADGNLYVDQP